MRSRLYEGKSLKPSARTLWEIQALAMHPPVEVSTNLYAYSKERASACIKKAETIRAGINDMTHLRARQADVREAFLRCIGHLPKNASTINAAVTSRIECASYYIENIILETRPDYYATCSVYTPRQAVHRLIGFVVHQTLTPQFTFLVFVHRLYLFFRPSHFNVRNAIEHEGVG